MWSASAAPGNGRVSPERARVRAQAGQLGALALARAGELQPALDQRELELRDLVALHEHRFGLARLRGLERGELRGLQADRGVRFAHPDRGCGVLARDR